MLALDCRTVSRYNPSAVQTMVEDVPILKAAVDPYMSDPEARSALFEKLRDRLSQYIQMPVMSAFALALIMVALMSGLASGIETIVDLTSALALAFQL